MSTQNKKRLGALVSTHGTSPLFLQRAAIVATLSFVFFLIMLIFFYLYQQLWYFIMSSAFLVIYLFTMISWVLRRRNVVSVYENGISQKKFSATWDEINSVKVESDSGITIVKAGGESLTIPKTTANIGRIALMVRQNLP